MMGGARRLLWLGVLFLVAGGEPPTASSNSRTAIFKEQNAFGTPHEGAEPVPARAMPVQDPENASGAPQTADVDFCAGLHQLLEASADGFRSVTQALRETASGVFVGQGRVQFPGAVLCIVVQHLVHDAWKASYTCHFSPEDETVAKVEADRRFEALKQQTRSCVPKDLRERDETGGEDIGVVSTDFLGDPMGPIVPVLLNYNGGSSEHPSTIDLWLRVARSIPSSPSVGSTNSTDKSGFDRHDLAAESFGATLGSTTLVRSALSHGNWNPNLDRGSHGPSLLNRGEKSPAP